MAQQQYTAHPTVEPAPAPPHDYVTPEASPERFAAGAKGLQELGQGVQQAADTWAEMRKDALLNSALKEADAATEQYGKLNGSEAVAAENEYRQKVDQIFQHYGEQNPGKFRTEFDNVARRYQYGVLNGKIATHAITQGHEVTQQTNKSTMERGGDQAARNFNDPNEESLDRDVRTNPSARQIIRQGAIKQVQANGNAGVQGIVDTAIKNADAYYFTRVANAKFEANAPDGYDYVKKHANEMGDAATPLLEKFHARAEKERNETSAAVMGQIAKAPSHEVAVGIANANRRSLTDDQYNSIVNPQGPAATPAAPKQSPSDFVHQQIEQETLKPPGQPTQAPGQAAPPKPGAQIDVPLDGRIAMLSLSRMGRGQLVEEAIKQYPPLTTLNVSGRKFTIPAAGTTFEIEGIKHTIPASKAAAPAVKPATSQKQSENFSPVQQFAATAQSPENAPGQQAIKAAFAPTLGGYSNKLGGLEPGQAPPPPGVTDTDAVAKVIKQTPATPGAIADISAVSGIPAGHKMEHVNGMIIHHSGGEGTVFGLIHTLKQRGLSAQFAVDRDGKTYQLVPDGMEAHHIMNGWGPLGEGKSNRNMQGVEVIARDNRDVTPAQVKAVQALVAHQAQKYGYDPATSVFGHGEVNPGHKEADEGMSSVNVIRGQTQQAAQ